MPRKSIDDQDEIIDRAMHLFWQRGYKKTSVEDLIQGAGINRFSLYETYGGKHGLYLKAMDKYRDDVFLKRMDKIDNYENGLLGIQEYFESLEEFLVDCKGDFTCLMMNSQIELVPRDKKVAKKVSFYFEKMEETFSSALTRAKKKGALAKNTDVQDLAKLLTGSAQGMCVMSKSQNAREFLRAYTKSILKILKQT
ncbi:MAG: TetR/AcrR family transcriptional regulator [Gammaproteobacteria bacterium]|nr:TetR/AcrR family transcriptional regulator [Gammaproteobacteria bacterium]